MFYSRLMSNSHSLNLIKNYDIRCAKCEYKFETPEDLQNHFKYDSCGVKDYHDYLTVPNKDEDNLSISGDEDTETSAVNKGSSTIVNENVIGEFMVNIGDVFGVFTNLDVASVDRYLSSTVDKEKICIDKNKLEAPATAAFHFEEVDSKEHIREEIRRLEESVKKR